ncbi:hypothetical protein VIGAN_04319800 [Vigna angularis var. angularis]|uniref:Uncharacterized protein n=1 Tax=Vigna angularis var. angularis TaxID=157739 RepID=A0A0S3RYH4_PHAAN|nr:hypothetical protein VIGAN_04319800 [Vigna angularis var. angularis]
MLDERPLHAGRASWTSVGRALDERPLSSKWRPGAPFYLAPGREPLGKLAPRVLFLTPGRETFGKTASIKPDPSLL